LLARYEAVLTDRISDGVRSPATLAMVRAHRKWWRDTVGDCGAAELTAARLDELVTSVRRAPHAAGVETLRKRLSTLHPAFEAGARAGVIAAAPPVPRIATRRRPRNRVLQGEAQARALYHSLPPHRARWVWLALWTAQHPSDVERMAWIDVRPGEFLRRNTKGGATPLWVVSPPPLELELWTWPREGATIVRPWPSRRTTLALHCRRLGLPELNATDLRHTCASWLVAELGVVAAVWEYLGHSGPAMLNRYYAHCLRRQLGSCAEALGRLAEIDYGATAGARPRKE
jgi:integrase